MARGVPTPRPLGYPTSEGPHHSVLTVTMPPEMVGYGPEDQIISRQNFLLRSNSDFVITAATKHSRLWSTFGGLWDLPPMTIFLSLFYPALPFHIYLARLASTHVRKCALVAPFGATIMLAEGHITTNLPGRCCEFQAINFPCWYPDL